MSAASWNRTIAAALAVGLLAGAGCAESVEDGPSLSVQLFTATAPRLDPIPPDMPGVRISLKDYTTGELLKTKVFGVGDSGASLGSLPYGDQLQMVVEGLDANQNPILRGASTPFAFSATSNERRVPVFFTRLETFSDATTLTLALGQPSVQPVRLTTARAGHAQTPLTGGRTLFTGGAALEEGLELGSEVMPGGLGLSDVSAAVEIYDPAQGIFFPLPELITPRAFHTATQLPDGRILVVGGVTIIETDDGPVVETVRPAEIFDPSLGSWRQIVGDGALQTGRAWHTATLRRVDGRVVFIGGRNITRGRIEVLGDAEVFNPQTERFGGNAGGGAIEMSHPRAEHAAVQVRAGAGLGADIVVIGGQGADGDPVGQMEVLRGTNNNTLFEFDDGLPSMETPRWGQVSIPISPEGGGLILTLGGVGEGGGALRDVEIFDTVQGLTAEAGRLSAARGWTQAVELPATHNVVVFGGLDDDGQALGSAEVLTYNAANGRYETRSVSAALTTARFLHQATLLSNGLVLLTGGVGDGESLNRAEVFNADDGSPVPLLLEP